MIKQIRTDDLKIGMYIEDVGISWLQAPYLYYRPGPVSSQKTINKIKRDGYIDVFINTEKGIDVSPGEELLIVEDTGLRPHRRKEYAVPVEEELPVARKTYDETIGYSRRFIQNLRKGKAPNFQESEEFIAPIVESVTRNETALLHLSKLRRHDEYTYTHSVNVAVLAVIFGNFLGLSKEQLRVLGVAGLLHDVGKERVPQRILNKPGRLTLKEFKIIQKHSLEGYAIIKDQKGIHPQILRCIVEHHERYDGLGYPEGLRGDDIDEFSTIVSAVDIYDALTSDRSYKEAIVMHNAMKILFAMRDKELPGEQVERFIKCVGVFPVGSFVRLTNGMYARVRQTNTDRLLYPVVKIVLDAGKRPVQPEIIDLATHPTDAQGRPLRIANCCDPKALAPFLAKPS
ncbi:MAG: HD-GYP domain-containing protein [Desulfovibrionales bacterium]